MIPVEDILGAGDHQGVAIAGGILAAVVALFIAIDKGRTAHMQKRWEEVCRRTLQARDSRQHKVLKSGDANKVGHGSWAGTFLCSSCAVLRRSSMGCGSFAHGGTSSSIVEYIPPILGKMPSGDICSFTTTPKRGTYGSGLL